MSNKHEIIVIGGGHAGIEAVLAAARMGCSVLLLTSNLDRIGWMSCNPSIGGLAKSHLVREIDALGGQMGLLADATGIQFRMLNTGKGPAVRSLRSQNDRALYAREAKAALERQTSLAIRQEMAAQLLVSDQGIAGVVTEGGREYRAHAVILATGTFLNGLIHIGNKTNPAGRSGDAPSGFISNSLSVNGLELGRLKTGTPARIASRGVDFSKMTDQPGDADPAPFSYRTKVDEVVAGPPRLRAVTHYGLPARSRTSASAKAGVQARRVNLRRRIWPSLPQASCHLTWTNPAAHEIIRRNLDRSPLYSGRIKGVGPRYCPSIEDKVVRFAGRDGHQVFLEPEGLHTDELYLNGLSSSLPEDVQEDFIHSIAGLEQAVVTRFGYAIEYDFVFPEQLFPTLETKSIAGLYLAGQINGTSGYEEAAAQGLMAGINAALKARGDEPLILRRDEAYIGVLIDDLVTKGTREPYRMFTSRAEYRLLLRQDNADERLMGHGRRLGLIGDAPWDAFQDRREEIAREAARLSVARVRPHQANEVLSAIPTAPLAEPAMLADLLKRPEVGYEALRPLDQARPELDRAVVERVVIGIKYDGYIRRQREEAAKLGAAEGTPLAPDLDYGAVYGLTSEARQKLSRARPATVGQAARISGISPADIGMIMIHLKRSCHR
ncbi:MAG: tRNA uridine-5-carboxymethylaminomethyl(34) synthesis enzyme MnmG [Candidatus Edwardsbacteria bacterium]|nr:tRNA uridine-5-carboxymethylaminomethyl(34) synthesis enzyme MnmG [Candidatus Edwardsbacteria bacterium]